MGVRSRSGIIGAALLAAAASVLSVSGARADCSPPGTHRSDTITCTGTDTAGIEAGSGNDHVAVLPDASVVVEVVPSNTPSIAIDVGTGDDTVENDGIVSLTANPPPVPVSASSEPLGCSSSGSGTVIGVSGGRGNDVIENRATVSVQTTRARPSNQQASSSCARTKESVGVRGDSGDDTLKNSSAITVSESSSVIGTPVAVIGIDGGDGNDEIVNAGSITATASAVQHDTPVFPLGSSSSGGGGSAGEPAATAVGIVGGDGKDAITNDGTVTVTSTASIGGLSPSLMLDGGDDVDASTTVDARAAGITGGDGKDRITNNGSVSVSATGEVDNVAVEANLIDLSHANTSTTVTSTATGLDGGRDRDRLGIGNAGTVDATAVSRSKSVAVEANLVDAAVSDSTLVVDSKATGIDTGTGHNHVDNAGHVAASATSEALDVGVNASFVDATLAEGRGSNVSTTLNATAVGIDSSKGKDKIDVASTGTVHATATSDVHSVGVSLASEGVPGPTVTLFRDGGLADIGINSNSDATGIVTGDSYDRVDTAGDVTAKATSTAQQESINVGVALFDFHIPTPGIVLGSAGTDADASATGIATGAGGDKITNKAHVDVDADATASATTVSANIAKFFSTDLAEDYPSGPPIGASLVVADTKTQATAKATGIEAGDGNDVVKNEDVVESNANATGGSTSASASLDVEYKEGNDFFAADAVGARSTTNADATAVGIDTGSGRNRVTNTDRVSAGATADGNTVSVGVTVSGALQGNGGALNLAATDTSTTGTATATGIQGGADRDKIGNSGTVEATTDADVDGVNVGVTAAVAQKGLVAGASLARSVSESHATSVGIDGGGGGDKIENKESGTVTSNATANAGAVAVSVNIDGTTRGVAGGGALTDAHTTATAVATGIRTGDSSGDSSDHGKSWKHDDRDYDRSDDYGHGGDKKALTNDGTINVDAQAHTHGVGVSAEVAVAEKGVAVGGGLANTGVKSTSTAQGIEAGDGENDIANNGSIHVKSGAGSAAVSVSLSVAGTTAGVAGGAALTDSSVIVDSNATGVEAGGGNDRVTNSGSITFDQAESHSTAVSVSAAGFFAENGVAIGAALGRTAAEATTNATGIDGAEGNDKLINRNAIAMDNVNAHADAVGVSLGVGVAQNGVGISGALVDGTSTANVDAKALEGGSGDDLLVNTGSVGLHHGEADADAVSISVNATGVENGAVLGGSLLDADATANMTAAGLSGGSGDDALINKGSISVEDMKANSDGVGVGASLTVAGNGFAAGGAFALTGAKANADAEGMDGGDGRDFLYNAGEGGVTVRNIKSEADAVGVSVGLSGGDAGLFIGGSLADASGKADTVAAGIDGGAQDDAIINNGKIVVDDVGSDAHAVGVTVGAAGANAGVAAGVSIADTSGIAHTHAKGIDGGSGDDFLWSGDDISLTQVKSHAGAVGVGVSLGVTLAGGVAGGISLSDAGATATTDAFGIDGGSADDKLFSVAGLTLDGIEANTNAAGVSVELGVSTAGVGIGGSLADTRTNATANATALSGATGDDLIVNKGDVLLRGVKSDAGATSVGVTVNGAIEGGVAAGVSLTDASSHATTSAVGMDGGDGNDKLYNKGTISAENVEASARATGVSVSAQASFAGIAGGAAIADTGGSAKSTVKGVDGGDGNDKLRNDGTVNVAGKAKSGATSIGISVSGTIGVAGGAEITNADMSAQSIVTGLDGARGRDAITNTSDVTATSNAETDSKAISVGVSVGVGGDASLADATTTATATATGIDGGEADVHKRRYRDHGKKKRHDDHRHYGKKGHGERGHGYKHGRGDDGDEIVNDGTVVAIATSTSHGTSVGGNLFGFALGGLTNNSTAAAFGIHTRDAEDKVRSTASIEANANASASGLSVAVQLGGKAVGDVSTMADASSAGVATGGGNDKIENTGMITTDARSNASANGVSVGLLGVSEADASVTALAATAGIDGGDGNDTIVNHGTITVSAGTPTDDGGSASCPANAAGTCARVSGVSVNLGGAGFLDATTEARSAAAGIDGGAGKDKIDSDGAVDATARAKTVAGGTNVNIAGAALSDAQSKATADATGIAGGEGDDFIQAAGTIDAESSSHIVVSNFGFSLAGVADFDATLDASARGTAIDGGTGRDKILNGAALTARGRSTVSSGGDSTVVFGASGSGARSGAFADAAGIRGGTDGDFIGNSGTIDSGASTHLSLGDSTFTFGGGGGSGGRLTATTGAAGINGDAGHDLIVTGGGITVDATSTLNASSGSTVVFGAGSGGASSGAATHAFGIDGGDDGDGILNKGALVAGSRSTLTLSGSSFTFGGAGGARGSLTADTATAGIAGGDGFDAVGNEGDVTANATSSLSTSGGSKVAFGSGSSGADTGAVTDAKGIAGGEDGDFIRNGGKVTANSTATLSLSGGSFTFGGGGGTSGTLTATTRSTAIAGDAGEDIIKNDGELHVTNTSTLTSSGGSDVAFGSSGANSKAGSVAEANGIDGGSDDDFVWSKGKIFVDATANLTLGSSSYTFGGTGDVGGRLNATTRAAGIQGGTGDDVVGSEADIKVTARSTMQSSGKVNTTFGTSASGAVVATDIGATGIDGGSGNDVVKNHAGVDVDAIAKIKSSSSSYVFGGDASGDDVANASANAAGLRGGDGEDFIFNDGDVNAQASATISGAGSAHAEFGGSDSSGTVAASSTVRGVDGGAGSDTIRNEGSVTAIGTLNSGASHSTGTGFLFGGATSKTAARGSGTVFGIDAGSGDNEIFNSGIVVARLLGSASTSTNSDGADFANGDAHSRSTTTLSGSIFGIFAGAGADTIENEGTVTVDTRSLFGLPTVGGSATASADGDGVDGDGHAIATTTTSVGATGIDAGAGVNVITNRGTIGLFLATGASTSAHADGDSVGGDATADSTATTHATAIGIRGGNDGNAIENDGSIQVDLRASASAGASATVDHDPVFGFALGSAHRNRTAAIAAHGYGIRTGSGDDRVVNKGSIVATTRADNNTGSGDVSASAAGIDTGAGNDTIINEGTITATRVVNGSSSRGTAIAAGTGDDVVKLLDGSVTNGNVDLGSGDDMLSLEGTPVINGSFLNASSELSLEFNNSGSYAGGLPGVKAIKNGDGTFNLSLLNQMELIEVNKGTLKLNNDYDFLGTGLFQAKVYGDGSNGQFYVNGEAGLDGKMKIVRGGGAYRDGTIFEVFKSSTAIKSGTAFNDVELPDATRLLKFDARQKVDGVHVTANVASFTTVAETENQMAVARNLDRVLPKVSGDLSQIMGEVQALPEGQYATAFASLSPASYAVHSSAALGTANQYAGVLQDRMNALRNDRLARAEQHAGLVRLAYNGSASDVVAGSGVRSSRAAGLWLRAFGQKGDRESTNGANGFEYNLSGIAIGLDRRFSDRVSAGVSLATAGSNVKADNNMSDGDVDSRFLSAYASYFENRLYVNGTLSVGRNDYDTRRNMIIGMVTTPLTSNHKGDITAASIGTGRYYAIGRWWADPFAYLQYTRLEEDSFTENGSGAGLNVASRATDALVSTVGVRFSRIIESGNGGAWIPEATLGWVHDFAIDDQLINASYIDAPDASFAVNSEPMNKNGTAVGLGIGYRSADGFSSLLKYAGEFRGNFDAHGIVGEVRWEF